MFVIDTAQRRELSRRRVTLERRLECPRDSLRGSTLCFFLDSGAKCACRFHVGRVVQEYECLLWNVRAVTLRGTFLTARGIEGKHTRVQKASLPPRVQTAAPLALALVRHPVTYREVEIFPVALGLIRLHAWTTDFWNQQTRKLQCGIANLFRLETWPALAGKLTILRVTVHEGLTCRRYLLICCGCHNQPHHVLCVPAALAELDRHKVHQGRVGRRSTLRAEVIEDFAHSNTEELLPSAVHHGPGRQRVLWT